MQVVYGTPRGIEDVGRSDAEWRPLHISASLANTVDDINSNIESALKRDYVPFNALIGIKSGAVAIVGSGPSLKKNWRELKKFKGDIIACNASFQFLLERGITPTYMMCFDADPLMLEFLTPHPEVIYLLGSRCPPKAFDILSGCRIVCWHAAGDNDIQAILEKHQRLEPMVIGGSAAVTRSIVLAMPLGYKEIHVYGGDSSFAEGDTHIRQSTTVEKRMAISCNGRVFEVAPWMTVQVTDLERLVPTIKALGIRMHFHGDGLLQHVARTLGFRTDYDTAYQRTVRAALRWWLTKAVPTLQAI